MAQLTRPGRDPREDLPPPIFKSGILKLDDLQPGMELMGSVLNVVDFGAFVDIGLHDSGLVHVSQLANQFVRDPHDVVSVGDIVKVWVMEIDKTRRRVSLTMIPPGTPKHEPRQRGGHGDANRGGSQRRGGRAGGQRPGGQGVDRGAAPIGAEGTNGAGAVGPASAAAAAGNLANEPQTTNSAAAKHGDAVTQGNQQGQPAGGQHGLRLHMADGMSAEGVRAGAKEDGTGSAIGENRPVGRTISLDPNRRFPPQFPRR